MTAIAEVLFVKRLREAGLGLREIADVCGCFATPSQRDRSTIKQIDARLTEQVGKLKALQKALRAKANGVAVDPLCIFDEENRA